MKQCTKCSETKELTEFNKDRAQKSGLAPACRECHKRAKKAYLARPEVKERAHQRSREHYKKNKESHRKKNTAWAAENKERLRELQKNWYDNNKEQLNEKLRIRRREDPEYNLRCRVSNSIWWALKHSRGHKEGSCFEALPYTPQQLKEHLESQFQPWMTWDNYGEWHVDHIYPQSLLPYDSLDHPNFLKCWTLENLQPLEARENIIKSNKVPALA